MDALAQLALMSKAKLVFERPETFLSFPALSPVSYKANDLNFDSSNVTTAQLLVLSEFSRIVNSRPMGTIFPMEGDTYLWDTYRQLLNTAILARGSATPEDNAAYQQAVAFLTTTDAQGISDSPARSTYKQYRDAYFKATEDYNTEQSTATFSTNAEVKNRWDTIDEPRLRALMQQAEADWSTKGFKEQVEMALQVAQAHAARVPQTTWDQWARLYDPSIDILTDTNTQIFPLTSYDPHGIFDQDWPTFRMTRDEIARLVEQAPAELKGILATEGTSSTVESLSFEYRSVGVTRPWFRSAVFDERFWRLPDGANALSDGGDPSQGAWPAYVAALVFVRNISLTMWVTASDPPPSMQPIRAFPAFLASRLILPQATMVHALPMATAPPAVSQAATAVRATSMRAASDNPRVASAMGPEIRFTRSATMMGPPVAANMMLRLRANTFTTLPATIAPPLPPPPPPPPNTVTQQGTRDDISILAFICKRLPKSPDPDPALTW